MTSDFPKRFQPIEYNEKTIEVINTVHIRWEKGNSRAYQQAVREALGNYTECYAGTYQMRVMKRRLNRKKKRS